MMPLDWQIAAYEAALRDDHDAIVASLGQLKTYGRGAIEVALHAWMERTELAMVTLAEKAHETVAFAVPADEQDGRPVIDPAVAWGGQLFTCHVSHDREKWKALFSAVPDGDEFDSAVYTTLKLLAVTAKAVTEAYTEKKITGPAPDVRSARLARAHYN